MYRNRDAMGSPLNGCSNDTKFSLSVQCLYNAQSQSINYYHSVVNVYILAISKTVNHITHIGLLSAC